METSQKHSQRAAQLPNVRIGLLIGSNCPKALEPIDVLASEDGGPFAIRTFAGWAIVGPLYMCGTENSNVSYPRVAASEVGSERHLGHHFKVERKEKREKSYRDCHFTGTQEDARAGLQ